MTKWLTTKQAAAYANVHKVTLWRWSKRGLKCAKINGVVRFRADWLDEFIERGGGAEDSPSQ